MQRLNGHLDSITAVAISRDGTLIMSVLVNQNLRFWRLCIGATIHTVYANVTIKALWFYSNGNHLETDQGMMFRIAPYMLGDIPYVIRLRRDSSLEKT